MLTEKQKEQLTNHIYKMINESIFENGYFENAFFEKKKEDGKKNKKDDEEEVDDEKRNAVIKWLDSAQELHSVLAYRLYPHLAAKGEVGKGTARSKFSQKYRNYEGKKFTAKEINILYNLRNDFIDDAELDV